MVLHGEAVLLSGKCVNVSSYFVYQKQLKNNKIIFDINNAQYHKTSYPLFTLTFKELWGFSIFE